MTDLTALISRLEAAIGPDRLLDRDIGIAVLGWQIDNRTLWVGGDEYPDHPGAEYPSPTESIDDALTLVPDGWSWRVGNLPSGRGFADLGTQASLQCVEGATPALALCITALKARAATEVAR